MIPPEPIVPGPMTAAPPPPMPAAQPNGSIYQPRVYGNYPLFEDRRPRNVGDIVTIVLNERTNAAKNVATNTDRSGNVGLRSEEHTSELQSLMRNSYAVFCLKKKIKTSSKTTTLKSL